MKSKILVSLLLALVMVVTLATPVLAGPPTREYQRMGGPTGHYYKYFEDLSGKTYEEIYIASQITWTNPDTGIEYQGHLVTIDSRRENGFVFRKLVKSNQNIAIALRYLSGSWTWDNPYAIEPFEFSYWAQGYPLPPLAERTYALMQSYNGKWLNMQDSYNNFKAWVVEFEPVP